MSEPLQDAAQDDLIRGLTETLTPIKPLAPPIWRALIWIGVVVAFGIAASAFANLPALERRLMTTPDMWLAVLGSSVTAMLAAFAAFQLSLPDRSSRWALLPLPPTLIWIGASGAGCLRGFSVQAVRNPTMGDERDCLMIILGFSIPLSLALLLMLRRGYTLRPGLTASIAGLAVAAAAATLLIFFHPFDATVSDLIAHGVGVALVIAAIRWFGARDLSPESFSRMA